MPVQHDFKRAMRQLLAEMDRNELTVKPLTIRLQSLLSEMIRTPRRWRMLRARHGKGVTCATIRDDINRFHRRMSSWRKRQGVVR